MAFADNLRTLPSVAQIASLELLNDTGEVTVTIPNLPGKAGSLAVYAALVAKHGSINVAAAEEGLILFAEHTDDARKNPGNHPNIDRLLEVIKSGQGYQAKVIAA